LAQHYQSQLAFSETMATPLPHPKHRYFNPIEKVRSADLLETFLLPLALSLLVFIPQWRYGFNLSDEGWLWYLSQRIHAGDLPIRDFFAYDPGRYFWTAAWFRLLGHDGLLEQRIANAAFGAVGLMFAYGAMQAARVPRPWRLTTVCLLALALGFPRHKAYEQALSLIAVTMTMAILVRPCSIRRWIAFGIATGLTAVIGRNSGVYFLITAGLSLAWTARDITPAAFFRRALSYGAGVVVGYVPILYLLATDVRFRRAFITSVREVASWELPLPIPFPWRSHGSFANVLTTQQVAVSWLCVIIIVIYVVAAIRHIWGWRHPRSASPADHLETAALFAGIPYLHHAFDRADFSHIAQGILPVFLLATSQLVHVHRAKLAWRGQYVVLIIVAALAWFPSEPRISAYLANRMAPGSERTIDISGHSYLIDKQTASIMETARQATAQCGLRDDAFLEAPHYPGLYAYLHVRSPIWELYFLYQRPASFEISEIGELEKRRPSVVLLNENATVDGNDALYLRNSNPILLAYIHSHYVEAQSASDAGPDFKILTRDCRLGHQDQNPPFTSNP
jgi:hypothetical protein